MNKKCTLLVLLTLLWSVTTFAGDSSPYWQSIHPGLVRAAGEQQLKPDRYQTYMLQTAAWSNILLSLPQNPDAGLIIALPVPDGSFRDFKVWQTPMMEPALAAKYPEIRTFTAEATGNSQVTAKIDLSPAGFHAMIYDGTNTYLIDPYSDVEDGNYLCYYKKDCSRTGSMTCAALHAAEEQVAGLSEGNHTGLKVHGSQRRTYRLALACTFEYATAVGGPTPTKASVLAQMVLIMNRVNGVYEREFASTMSLVANTDTLIYLTAADPYTNNDGNNMLGQNISTINSIIGTANYDIGHVFSTGGGGVAYLAALCFNSIKAGGVTGLSNPVGDPFAIDYVAHEMGHQFGSDHTFNSDLGSCNGNGAATLSFEPGSGSTIMAYAGICGTDDLQNNSDAYFHAASLREIINNITNVSAGGACPVISASTNTPNTYPDFTSAYSIPVWTPFELTAPAVTDATSDTLRYCWEEWDLGGFGLAWNANNNTMPFFRSFSPASSPVRVFPTMNNILAGTYSYKGERLPTAARTLKFILTTRDIYQGWGCVNSSYDTDTITLNAVVTPDTFQVTSQATATSWNTGSTQTITWDVAGTTAAPVNAANVNIYLSVDSGKTFPYTLAAAVANNGSASVTVPALAQPTTKARVKVKGANNVFFQVNRSNININVVPLPVPLTSFSAVMNGCTAQLSWTTETARNFRYFLLERSADGLAFGPLAIIRAGNESAYSYTDKTDKDGDYYYRLKMTDNDGQYKYSTTMTVRASCNGPGIAVFPNPANEYIIIRSNGNISEAAVFSATGQLVLGKQVIKGQQTARLNISSLAKGIYLLQLSGTDDSRNMIKLIRE